MPHRGSRTVSGSTPSWTDFFLREHIVFISVVIPAHNEEKYLARALESLRSQRYPASQYEIIVVDNCSTDATAEIARRYGAIVVPEDGKGVARARQTGFEAARGEIIASTDGDVDAPPDWLQNLADVFQRNPQVGGMTGPVHLYDGNGLVRWWFRYVNNHFLRFTRFLGFGGFSGNNFAVRREPFLRVGGFRTSLLGGEDTDLALRLRMVTKLVYDQRTLMRASARRAKEGYLRIMVRAAATHVKLWWLDRAPDGFPDIR